MVVIVNGYFKVGSKYLNHSAIWEDTENENMTIGNLIDQFSSYIEKVKVKFIHISKSDKALILQFINECFDDAVKILSENNYDMDVNPEEYHISKKLKSYKERIRLE